MGTVITNQQRIEDAFRKLSHEELVELLAVSASLFWLVEQGIGVFAEWDEILASRDSEEKTAEWFRERICKIAETAESTSINPSELN